jgi:hypothetical protein
MCQQPIGHAALKCCGEEQFFLGSGSNFFKRPDSDPVLYNINKFCTKFVAPKMLSKNGLRTYLRAGKHAFFKLNVFTKLIDTEKVTYSIGS